MQYANWHNFLSANTLLYNSYNNTTPNVHHTSITSQMEVYTSFINDSSNGSSDSTLDEFPQWKLTTAITLVNRLVLLVPTSLLTNTSVLVTILKTKSLQTPDNLIHLFLPSANCVVLIHREDPH